MSKIEKHANLVNIVAAHVAETGRGMETFRLQAQGFTKAQVAEAIEDGALESRRGRTGGIYVAGQVPETQPVSTLKGEAFAVLKAIYDGDDVDTDVIESLLERYAEECQRRSEAKKKGNDSDD